MAGKEQFNTLIKTLGELENALPDLWVPTEWIELSRLAELAAGDAAALMGAAGQAGDAKDLFDMLDDLADKAKVYKEITTAFCADDAPDGIGGAPMATFRNAINAIKGFAEGKADSFS